jgi:hypothetical protein
MFGHLVLKERVFPTSLSMRMDVLAKGKINIFHGKLLLFDYITFIYLT